MVYVEEVVGEVEALGSIGWDGLVFGDVERELGAPVSFGSGG